MLVQHTVLAQTPIVMPYATFRAVRAQERAVRRGVLPVVASIHQITQMAAGVLRLICLEAAPSYGIAAVTASADRTTADASMSLVRVRWPIAPQSRQLPSLYRALRWGPGAGYVGRGMCPSNRVQLDSIYDVPQAATDKYRGAFGKIASPYAVRRPSSERPA